jgi:ribonucleoside-triphosphate reductase
MSVTVKTRDIAAVEAELAAAKEALANVRGTETEVYARIVGYYRSVRNWNKGKRDEYNHRKQFVYEGTPSHKLSQAAQPNPALYELTSSDVPCACTAEVKIENPAAVNADAVSYELFVRKTCPNCPPVKEYMAGMTLQGTVYDVDTEEGFERASQMGVLAAPTVIFYNSGNETGRAHSVEEIEALTASCPAEAAC